MMHEQEQRAQEDAYFYKINKELLERMRKEQDAKKNAEAKVVTNPHWMKCPKCGDNMEEIELMRIKVDKCVKCSGVYFDDGELDILLESKEPKGFLGLLKKLF